METHLIAKWKIMSWMVRTNLKECLYLWGEKKKTSSTWGKDETREEGNKIEERLIMEAWKGVLSNHKGKGTIMQESGLARWMTRDREQGKYKMLSWKEILKSEKLSTHKMKRYWAIMLNKGMNSIKDILPELATQWVQRENLKQKGICKMRREPSFSHRASHRKNWWKATSSC